MSGFRRQREMNNDQEVYGDHVLNARESLMTRADMKRRRAHLAYVDANPQEAKRLTALEGKAVTLKRDMRTLIGNVIPKGTRFRVLVHIAGRLVAHTMRDNAMRTLDPDWVEVEP